MKRLKFFIFLLPALFTIFFVMPKISYADFNFTVDKTTITPDQEIQATVNLSLLGKSNTIYYLEGVFNKDTSTSYFGLTWNGLNWEPYTSINFHNLEEITTDADGKWSGTLRLKVDQSNSHFTGAGDYNLRIKRFTEGGSSEYSTDSYIVTIQAPPATPTPSSSPANQSTFTISADTTTITSDQTLPVKVNITNWPALSKFFIKGAFVLSGSTNYFGETLVNNQWIKNGDPFTSQILITTDENGNWSGEVTVRVDTSDNGYTGSKNYLLKVGKYTASGSGPTWSNSLNITVSDKPTPTPSPSQTTFPTNPPLSTHLPSPLGSLGKSNEDLKYLLSSDSTQLKNSSTNSGTVEGAFVKASPFPSITGSKPGVNWFFVAGGIFTISSGAGYFFVYNKKNQLVNIFSKK